MPVIEINTGSSQTSAGTFGNTAPIQGTGRATVFPQVIGLVPLFTCCDSTDAKGGFKFGNYDTVGCNTNTVVLDITLGGVDLGTFTYDNTTSNAAIQASIQALLPSGWTCTVSGVGISHVCTIYAPIGSGISGNASLVVTKQGTGCGGVVKLNQITGGKGDNSDCLNCDCREGKYGADSIPDDRKYTLPVFAEADCSDSYHNDKNSWLISYPLNYDPIKLQDFQLQELAGDTWTTITRLTTTAYGTPYNFSCTNLNYGGYQIDWQKVLAAFGEGTYRFYAAGTFASGGYCLYSPPFCLKTWDCILTDGTVKFEASYSGGNFGSVTDQGLSWPFCCNNSDTITSINWYDSIRIFGFFGYENAEFQRDQIKYATGAINKIRDEAIKNFTFKSSQLPMWFHQRFYSYGLMADQLYVSDYNLNNASYNYKHFWIVADSNYSPKYTGYTRYPKVLDVKFKEGDQFVFRDRCCGGGNFGNTNNFPHPHNGGGGVIPIPPSDQLRAFSNLDFHAWSNGDQTKFK